MSSPPQFSEICLVANLQTVGPMFISAAKGNIFDTNSGMLLAARIVITSGMGSGNTSGLDQLQGPISISEIDLDDEYDCYFIPSSMQQKPLPEHNFSTGEGTFILCLIYPRETKSSLRPFEDLMEKTLLTYIDKIEFDQSITGEVPKEMEEETSEILQEIYDEINELLEFAHKFKGGSLFDIGLIATLPDKLSATAKKIMLNPKGISEDEINDDAALKTLFQAGLVDREERDGEKWIIPR